MATTTTPGLSSTHGPGVQAALLAVPSACEAIPEQVPAPERAPAREARLAEIRAEIWDLMHELPHPAREHVLGCAKQFRRRRGQRWLHEQLDVALDRLERYELGHDDPRVTEILDRARQLTKRMDRAREELVLANLYLVPQAVRRFRVRSIPFTDLIQEGRIGLLQAVDRFDPSRGYRFATYAMWWIRRAVLEALSQRSRLIRLPDSLREDLRRMRRISRDLEDRLGRRPRPQELAAQMSLPLKKVRKLIDVTPDPTSIEDLQQGENALAGDALVPGPFERALSRELEGRAREALRLLEPRERAIIRLRFGFEGGEDRTLQEVGEMVGLSRERVRQIEHCALTKIQSWAVRRGLMEARAV